MWAPSATHAPKSFPLLGYSFLHSHTVLAFPGLSVQEASLEDWLDTLEAEEEETSDEEDDISEEVDDVSDEAEDDSCACTRDATMRRLARSDSIEIYGKGNREQGKRVPASMQG